jgi:spore photoproduct lyase
MTYEPEAIYIDDRVKAYPFTHRITDFFKNIPRIYIHNQKSFIKDAFKKPDAITEGKKNIFITLHHGKFLSKCPGTKNYICCGYHVLFPSSQCCLDCSYCILQSYFNNPLITFFANTDAILNELNKKIDANPQRLWRIGTGEFTDSLAFDNATHFSKDLITLFSGKKNAILELKTKTTFIDNLLTVDPRGTIVIGWSMNASSVVEREEHFASSITARLDAARTCAQAGYKIAFHFDPIFYYPGWEKDYKETIDLIFDRIDPKTIAWISLGCFRYMPSLKSHITTRFPESKIIFNEFITGLDGKKRYPKTTRIAIYKKIYQWITAHNQNVFIYLCMESEEVWQKSFGFIPHRFGSLKQALDKQVFPHV